MPADPGREQLSRRRALVAGLARHGITDPATLKAMEQVPRELFLPPAERASAYEDRALPIGFAQTCSQPLMVALVTEQLRLNPGAAVLEVGAGSGYLAAVLRAAGGSRVVAMELIPQLAAHARLNLARAQVEGVMVLLGDGREGAPAWAPYQGVVVSAATREIPPALRQQTAIGGRLICPVVGPADERLVCLHRISGDDWVSLDLGAARFVPLRGRS